MRVEITFAGDSHDAVISSEEVTKAVRRLFVQAEETAQAVQEIKVSQAQAAESALALRRIAQGVEQIGQEARKSRREVEELKLATAGSGGGFGGLLPGGARPRTAAVGLLGLLGASVSGPAGGAGLAGVVAGAGLIAPAAAAVGLLVASLHGLGDAIGGDRQAFEKLDGQTQQFVQTVRSLDPWLKSLQATARQGILPGLDKALHELLNPQNTAAIDRLVKSMSAATGRGIAGFASTVFGSPDFERFLNNVGTHGATDIEKLADAAGHLAHALVVVLNAGQPVTDWLANVTDEGAKFVDQWVKASDASGALTGALQGGRGELELVARLVGALANAAFNLGRDLEPLGNGVIRDLTVVLQDLADWLDQNRDKVEEITTGALKALEDTVRLLAPLVADFARDLQKVADAVGGWENAFKIVIAGTLANALGKVAVAITGIGTQATVAAGESEASGVALLLSRLGALSALGVIGVEIAISEKFEGGDPLGLQTLFKKKDRGLFDIIAGPAGHRGVLGNFLAKIFGIDDGSGSGSTPKPSPDTGFRSANLHRFDYPLATHGQIIGTPYQGTHGKAFNVAGGSDNWESENAVDISVKVGTKVLAVEDGYIGQQIGSLGTGGRFAGLRLHLLGDSGNEYYYAHLSSIFVKAGQRVKKGAVLGYSGSANGVAHLHFAQKTGNPETTIAGGATPETRPTSTTPHDTAGTGDNPFGTPPPFTGDKGLNILPARFRLAMAKAATTPGLADDRSSIRAAVNWLKANVGDLTGEDQINAYLELASLLGQLKSLAPKIKKHAKPALASQAGRISAHGEATGLLGLLDGNYFAEATAKPQSLANAQRHLAAVRHALEPEIKAIDKELGDKTLTAKSLATLRAQMAQYKKTITGAVDDVRSAIERQKGKFEDAWRKIAQAGIDALEKQRSAMNDFFDQQAKDYKSPSRMLLDTLTDTHDTNALNDALTAANKHLADALKGHQQDAQSQLDQIRQYVGTAFLTNAIDASQSAILGGDSQQIDGATILNHLHDLLQSSTVVDPDEVAAAQKEVDEAQYNIRVRDLGKLADAEEKAFNDQLDAQRKAYNDGIDAQEQAIQSMADNWENYFGSLKGNIDAIGKVWNQFFGAIGSNVQTTGGGEWTGPVDSNGVPLSAGFSGFDANGNWVGGNIDLPGFADGGDFVTTGPTPIMVGEGRFPERVTVRPVRGGSSGSDGGAGIGPVTVVLDGDLAALGDFVKVKAVEASPDISRRIGQTADMRRRSGRY